MYFDENNNKKSYLLKKKLEHFIFLFQFDFGLVQYRK